MTSAAPTVESLAQPQATTQTSLRNEVAPSTEAVKVPTRNESRGAGGLLQLVSFVIGNEEFAVPILSVHEINRMMQITRVPQSPPFVEGVINLRGRIIPVIDLRRRFGMESRAKNADSRIIVVEVEQRTLGFIVDRVQEVLRIDRAIIEPVPDAITGIQAEYLEGIAKLDDRLLILINLGRLFSTQQLLEITNDAGQPGH